MIYARAGWNRKTILQSPRPAMRSPGINLSSRAQPSGGIDPALRAFKPYRSHRDMRQGEKNKPATDDWDGGPRIAPTTNSLDNRFMKASPWQRRIKRAEELASQHWFASEILGFYAKVARFQEGLYGRLEAESERGPRSKEICPGPPELTTLIDSFGPFLSVVESH